MIEKTCPICNRKFISKKSSNRIYCSRSCYAKSMKKTNKIEILKDYAIMYVKRKNKTLKVLIDKEDVTQIANVGAWHAILDNTLQTPSYYIVHRDNSKTKGEGVIKLHRFIMNCPKNKIIDHINHNTLDNRKSNLKICTRFENQQNLRSKKTEQTGVYFVKKLQRGYIREFWTSNISKDGKRYRKDFKQKEDAIVWRKKMEKILYKEVM